MTKKAEWAVITGASGGIGRALAEQFAAQGTNLYIAARDKNGLEEVADNLQQQYGIEVKIFAGDLSKSIVVTDFADKIENHKIAPQYLVNNAGFGGYGQFVDTDWSNEEKMISLNIATLTYLTKRFGKVMKQRKSGRIMNVASIAGFLSGPNMAVYFATKAYVLHFSEAVNEELRHSGVTVTALCPGPTQTGFARAAHAENSSIFEGTLPTAEEVAAFGYKAMLNGQPVAVHGFRNRVLIQLLRFMPRQIAVRVVARTQA